MRLPQRTDMMSQAFSCTSGFSASCRLAMMTIAVSRCFSSCAKACSSSSVFGMREMGIIGFSQVRGSVKEELVESRMTIMSKERTKIW